MSEDSPDDHRRDRPTCTREQADAEPDADLVEVDGGGHVGFSCGDDQWDEQNDTICRQRPGTSAFRGELEIFCSIGALPVLTRSVPTSIGNSCFAQGPLFQCGRDTV